MQHQAESSPASNLRLKRVYAPPGPMDGTRVLVDRLWPRGLRKADAAVDRWIKTLAPSTELRRMLHADPSCWPAFRQRYEAELADHPEAVAELRALAQAGPVTLLYAARDEARNNAVVLRDVLIADASAG